jgi:hypothetical protein
MPLSTIFQLLRCILNKTFDYVLKLVSDLREVSGFLWVLRLPQPIKLTATYDITEILLKVALNTITHPHPIQFVFSARLELTMLMVIGTDCIGSCKSNYHTITTTTA